MQAVSGALQDEITEELSSLETRGLLRQRKSICSPQSSRIVIDGREVLNFCSNDYLGLANDPRVVRALQCAAEKYGAGSGASPLVCGRSKVHSELEEEVARLTARDKAILFSSGYLANLAIVTTLAPGREDLVFQDRLNHASLIDGALLCRSKLKRYPHKDLEALVKALGSKPSNRKLILTDAVFSMDGDIAPLAELAEISRARDALLVVDDAHGFGVFGENGGGTLEHLKLGQDRVPLMMATFGKAVGCAGAFVAGPENIIELMVQKARSYIYSTALAPALAGAVIASLQFLREEKWRREKLNTLISRFRNGAQAAGLVLQESSSPIQPLVIGPAKKAVLMSEALLNKGILITAIRPPAVPANTSRLRITLSANHTEEEIDILLDALISCCKDEKSRAFCGE